MARHPKIQVTKDYSLFKLNEKNREVLSNRVSNITESIEELDLTDCLPILINEKWEIIDGQTRYESCKLRGKPIYYVMKNLNGQTDRAMILLNSKQAKWTLDEYISHYAKAGIQDYIDILDCKAQYGVTSSTAACFVGNMTTDDGKRLRNGEFKAGKIKYSTFGDVLMDYKELFPSNYQHVFFIRSLIYVIKYKYYDHQKDYKKVIRNRFKLKGCADVAQYLQMWEEILNAYRRGEKVRIMQEYPKGVQNSRQNLKNS